jgi:hypothetical protein
MRRTYVPFLLYLALAGIGGLLLRGQFLGAVLIFLGGLAVKTWVGQRKQQGTSLDPDGGTHSARTSLPSGQRPE